MTLQTLMIVFCFVIGISADKNFELLFKSSTETFLDFPVQPEGQLPAWLLGEYVRNGLGQFEMGPRSVQHAFDAFSKLCKFTFSGNNSVYFSARMLDTHYFKDSQEEGTIAPYLLFDYTVPEFSLAERMKALLHGIDNTNINIVSVKQDNASWSLMAVSDFWQMYEFERLSLKTIGRVEPKLPTLSYINQILPLPLPSTAHPVPEYKTDNLINYVSVFDITPWGQNTINVIRIKSTKERQVVASIPVDDIPYMHSLGLSKKYAIILAHPLSVNVKRMLETANPSQSLDWKPEKLTQIYVVDILTGKLLIIKTKLQAKFNMHHINSYQISGRRIVMDYVAYPDVKFMKSLQLKTLFDSAKRNEIEPQAEIVRYIINLDYNNATMKPFPATPGYEFVNTMDMPAINENFRHKKHCFVYGVTFKSDNVTMSNTTLVKKNLCRAGRDRAWMGTNQYVSEPWFVPKPNATKEDDGLLLSLILDGDKAASYLAVLDAKTMTLVNRIYVPSVVPFTLHGKFLDYDILSKTN